jgi:hypothetical protein
MSDMIRLEVNFFMVSLVWGIILMIIYDGLRIFRRLVKHSVCAVSLEDILYWMVSAVLIFKMMYQQNSGIIRGFSIMAMGIGMALYHYTVSNIIVDWIVKLISLIFGPLLWMIHKIGHIIRTIFLNVKKIIKIIIKRLKISFKTVKIALTKK